MKILTVDKSKCNGCGACQVVCSLVKKGKVQPSEGRIRVRRFNTLDIQYVSVCRQCEEPACVSACMRGVIKKEAVTGIVQRKPEDCFGCASCNVRCPIGAVVYDTDLEAFVTCDLCAGTPFCVEVCPTGALSYEEVKVISNQRRQKYAEMLFMTREAE